MKRMGLSNQLRPEKAEEYKRLHAAAWPGVLATISACNIRNFSIFLRERNATVRLLGISPYGFRCRRR
jgi:L-rhamnose mutarotase